MMELLMAALAALVFAFVARVLFDLWRDARIWGGK